MTDPILILIAAVFVVAIVLALSLLVLVTAYVRAMHELRNYKAREDEIKKKVEKEAQELLEEAENRAQKIIDQSSRQASDLVRETDIFTDQTKKELVKRLSSAQEAIIQRLARENIYLIADVAKTLKKSTEKVTLEADKEAKQKIAQEYEVLAQELKNYKEERIKRIEEEVQSYVQDLAKEILGKSINLSDHEDLVMESLEKAKRDLTKL